MGSEGYLINEFLAARTSHATTNGAAIMRAHAFRRRGG